MYVPRHEELGIVLQDEHFLERKRWDFEGTPKEHHPLLLHYHPLELYRHQVIKQTDVVLASYLVGHDFSEEETRRTFDYYDPLTTGDSTLSACVQSVVASEVGYADAALDYFVDACMVDLLDHHGNTADGIHIASCGGTWLALVAGFGGLRDFDGQVRLDPRLPADWDRLRFRIQVRGQLIEVDITHAGTNYRLLEGSGILIEHCGEPLRAGPVQGRAIRVVSRCRRPRTTGSWRHDLHQPNDPPSSSCGDPRRAARRRDRAHAVRLAAREARAARPADRRRRGARRHRGDRADRSPPRTVRSTSTTTPTRRRRARRSPTATSTAPSSPPPAARRC